MLSRQCVATRSYVGTLAATAPEACHLCDTGPIKSTLWPCNSVGGRQCRSERAGTRTIEQRSVVRPHRCDADVASRRQRKCPIGNARELAWLCRTCSVLQRKTEARHSTPFLSACCNSGGLSSVTTSCAPNAPQGATIAPSHGTRRLLSSVGDSSPGRASAGRRSHGTAPM